MKLGTIIFWTCIVIALSAEAKGQACQEGHIEVEGRIKFICKNGVYTALDTSWEQWTQAEAKGQETPLDRECRQYAICITSTGEVTYPTMAVPGPWEREQELREEVEDLQNIRGDFLFCHGRFQWNEAPCPKERP